MIPIKDKMLFYNFLKVTVGPLFKIYYNPKIIGKEYIPTDGPIIVAGNHKHLYDQCLTILSTKRPLYYMAKSEYFKSKFAWFFKACGCIPVNRDGNDKAASNKALEILKSKRALGIFPEGTRNKTKEKLLPFKFGAVSLAKKSDAYIVPFAITGEYKFRSKNLTIRFGKPFKATDNLENDNKKLQDTVLKLMKKSVK